LVEFLGFNFLKLGRPQACKPKVVNIHETGDV